MLKEDVYAISTENDERTASVKELYTSFEEAQLRKTNVPDYKISAYLRDLYEDYIIFDDVALADAYRISDNDWCDGMDYYWNDMEEDNPLRD